MGIEKLCYLVCFASMILVAAPIRERKRAETYTAIISCHVKLHIVNECIYVLVTVCCGPFSNILKR